MSESLEARARPSRHGTMMEGGQAAPEPRAGRKVFWEEEAPGGVGLIFCMQVFQVEKHPRCEGTPSPNARRN